jgi:hypothetical protein
VHPSAESTVEALRGLRDAARSAQAAMVETERLATVGIERLEAGMRVADLIRASTASEDRQTVQGALDEVVEARHRFRLAAIAACMADGMAPREIAEAWGISRQRVDQFVQENRRASGT